MDSSICPNCKVPVTFGLPILDRYGMNHFLHERCKWEVFTGWSGGITPIGADLNQVLRENYSKLGIELS